MASPDLSEAVWRKSGRSGPTGDNCVELAAVDGLIAIRDSKSPSQPPLIFKPSTWTIFTDRLKML
jgi:hypothetical protein